MGLKASGNPFMIVQGAALRAGDLLVRAPNRGDVESEGSNYHLRRVAQAMFARSAGRREPLTASRVTEEVHG